MLTLENRDTTLPDVITAFSSEFALIKQKQWEAFRNRLRQDHIPESFVEIVEEVSIFLTPFISQIKN